ncbi:MAG: ComEA family DNA-binding protein [Granulosicoccus sp.]
MKQSARAQRHKNHVAVGNFRFVVASLIFIACGVAAANRVIPEAGELININAASVAEIARALPGIGPQKAQRIVDWRNKHGLFQYREQLLDIKGIGPKTLEKIEGFYHLGDQAGNLGSTTSSGMSDRWVLKEIIEQANHDRRVALGLVNSEGLPLPR